MLSSSTRDLIAALSLVLAAPAFAQFVPCGDPSLPPEQRWNPPNSAVTPELAYFYDIEDRMTTAFKGPNPSTAEPLAIEYLRVARTFRCNWNYGNAIHDANSILGLLALRAGDVPLAIERLQAAGASPGSPQLNSFGPSMQLAKELALVGQFDAVIQYLQQVRRFWKGERGSIDRWLADLVNHRVPDFGSSLRLP